MVANTQEIKSVGGPIRVVTAGALGVALGRTEWSLFLDRPSVAEAVRAIDVNTGGKLVHFLTHEGREGFYQIGLGREDNCLGREELERPSGAQDIYILPAVQGNQSGGAKILAALAIVAITVATGGFGAGLTAQGATIAFMTAASLAVGGIVQLLTPVPNFDQSSSEDSRRSNIFGGNATTVSQGGAVGLVYGRMRTSPMPISISYTAIEQNKPETTDPQVYTITRDDNGIVEYLPA